MRTHTLSFFFRDILRYPWRIAFLLLAVLCIGTANAAVPALIKLVVDDVANQVLNNTHIGMFLAAAMVSSLPLITMQRDWLQNHYVQNLRARVFKQLMRLDVSYHDTHGHTELSNQTTHGVAAAGELVRIFGDGAILIQLPVAFYAFYYIASYSVIMALSLLLFVCLFVIVGKCIGKRVTVGERDCHATEVALARDMREVTEHIVTIKAYHAEQTELARHQEKALEVLQKRNTLVWLSAGLFGFLSQSASNYAFFAVGVFINLAPESVRGSLTGGTVTALLMYAARVVLPASFVGNLYAGTKRASAMLEPLIDILEEKPKITESPNAIPLGQLQRGIELRNVSLSQTLRNISLTIYKGETLAIVGPSGSGKSTLCRILARLVDPDDGIVFYDGTDLREVTFDSLYQNILLVQQNVAVLTRDLQENVGLGVVAPRAAMLKEATRRAHAQFKHEHGGEGGGCLSGGERQRIALARVFMHSGVSVVVLDEALSALDTRLAAHIRKELANLQKTVVMTTHDLSAAYEADRIVVMKDGTIAAVGTHEELLKSCKTYKELTNATNAA